MDNNIQLVFYSENNLNNIYIQVVNAIKQRTNKDISNNAMYKTSFNQMAKLVYNKLPENDRNLVSCNKLLIDKSTLYFHNKIFAKSVQFTNNTNTNNTNNTNNNTNNTNTNNINNIVNRPQSTNTILNNGYSQQIPQVGNINNTDINNTDMNFNIEQFNISDDFTNSLISNNTQDIPLYQNIKTLQEMNNTNPMTILEDYTKQRNAQTQQYINNTARQNITAQQQQQHQQPQQQQPQFQHNPPPQLQQLQQLQNGNNNTQIDSNKLTKLSNELSNKFMNKIEKNINNDLHINNLHNNDLHDVIDVDVEDNITQIQEKLIVAQREAQPKYIEKVHYININSVDRDWTINNAESRYKFQVKFNQNSEYEGSATIAHMYRNIVSVELVSAIMPMDSHIEKFDTRIYMGLSRYPYLLLRIDELDNVFRGTNNWVDKAFSTLLFDKAFHTNTLSSDYISGTNTSIVNSTPKQGFHTEYLRGFMKYNPAYFEKKKFYNNPLANLNRMSITITDPRGNFINVQKDVLNISAITYTTDTVDAVTGTELIPTSAWPWSTQSSYKMIKITTSTYFSNRLFRIGDRVIINLFAFKATHNGTNDGRFLAFITRNEGHVIINLDVETNGTVNTDNRGFINNIYISPPGEMDSNNKTIDASTYYDDTNIDLANVDTYGRLINIDMQTQLLFRIVTRDPDTATVLQPINIY